MNLWELYQKFQELDKKARVWLSGPGADLLGGFIEINDKVTDAARNVRDYLIALGDGSTAAMSVQDVEAVNGLKCLQAEYEAMATDPRAAAVPPGLRDLIVLAIVELIKKLLEKRGTAAV